MLGWMDKAHKTVYLFLKSHWNWRGSYSASRQPNAHLCCACVSTRRKNDVSHVGWCETFKLWTEFWVGSRTGSQPEVEWDHRCLAVWLLYEPITSQRIKLTSGDTSPTCCASTNSIPIDLITMKDQMGHMSSSVIRSWSLLQFNMFNGPWPGATCLTKYYCTLFLTVMTHPCILYIVVDN